MDGAIILEETLKEVMKERSTPHLLMGQLFDTSEGSQAIFFSSVPNQQQFFELSGYVAMPVVFRYDDKILEEQYSKATCCLSLDQEESPQAYYLIDIFGKKCTLSLPLKLIKDDDLVQYFVPQFVSQLDDGIIDPDDSNIVEQLTSFLDVFSAEKKYHEIRESIQDAIAHLDFLAEPNIFFKERAVKRSMHFISRNEPKYGQNVISLDEKDVLFWRMGEESPTSLPYESPEDRFGRPT